MFANIKLLKIKIDRRFDIMPKCSDCGFLNQTIVGFKMEVDNDPSYSCLKGLTPPFNSPLTTSPLSPPSKGVEAGDHKGGYRGVNNEWDCEGYIKYTPGINDYFKYEEELKAKEKEEIPLNPPNPPLLKGGIRGDFSKGE
jgi:hypothetical protein